MPALHAPARPRNSNQACATLLLPGRQQHCGHLVRMGLAKRSKSSSSLTDNVPGAAPRAEPLLSSCHALSILPIRLAPEPSRGCRSTSHKHKLADITNSIKTWFPEQSTGVEASPQPASTFLAQSPFPVPQTNVQRTTALCGVANRVMSCLSNHPAF